MITRELVTAKDSTGYAVITRELGKQVQALAVMYVHTGPQTLLGVCHKASLTVDRESRDSPASAPQETSVLLSFTTECQFLLRDQSSFARFQS
jgi:hypothetical protein